MMASRPACAFQEQAICTAAPLSESAGPARNPLLLQVLAEAPCRRGKAGRTRDSPVNPVSTAQDLRGECRGRSGSRRRRAYGHRTRACPARRRCEKPGRPLKASPRAPCCTERADFLHASGEPIREIHPQQPVRALRPPPRRAAVSAAFRPSGFWQKTATPRSSHCTA